MEKVIPVFASVLACWSSVTVNVSELMPCSLRSIRRPPQPAGSFFLSEQWQVRAQVWVRAPARVWERSQAWRRSLARVRVLAPCSVDQYVIVIEDVLAVDLT